MIVILLASIILSLIPHKYHHSKHFHNPVHFVNEYINMVNNESMIRVHYDIQNKFVLNKIFRNSLSEEDSITKYINIFPDELDSRDIFKAMMHFGHRSNGHVLINTDMISLSMHSIYTDRSQNNCKYQFTPLLSNIETVVSLGRMCYNVYESMIDNGDWYNTDPFIIEDDYGWQDDGLRCYLYTNCDKSILILAIKGTSTSLFSTNDTTTIRDKYMDNIMFSCCCAAIDFTWTPVCSCYNSSNKCFHDCVSNFVTLQNESYFKIAQKIYETIRISYPQATIWITGHSLGGALASLIAINSYDLDTNNENSSFPPTSAIAFESPGEMLYAQRLGIFPFSSSVKNLTFDSFLSKYPIYHIYHTADPIPYGACVGKFSSCYYAGYALETKCHIGHVYEVNLRHERFDINKHKIRYLIDNVLSGIHMMPIPSPQSGCIDCPQWQFITNS